MKRSRNLKVYNPLVIWSMKAVLVLFVTYTPGRVKEMSAVVKAEAPVPMAPMVFPYLKASTRIWRGRPAGKRLEEGDTVVGMSVVL